jgi:hypothetical protein
MSSRTTLVTAGVAALGLLSGPVLSGVEGPSLTAVVQDVTLSYRWAKGDTLRYSIVQQSTTAISGIPGVGEMTIEQSTSQILKAAAEDVTADGTARVRYTAESMKMDMTSPMFSMAYDSANPAGGDALLKSVLSGLVGESFVLTMAPTGKIEKVEGLTAIAEKVFKNVPNDPSTAGMLDGLKANMTDDAMRSLMTQTFPQFPGKTLKVGDSWNSEVSSGNPMLGTLVTTIVSTLKAVDGAGSSRMATVTTALTVKQDASKPPPPNPMGFSMQMGEASGDGEQVFEAGSGKMRKSTTRLSMPLSMSGTGPDGSPMNLKTTVKSTTTVELVEK